MVVLVRLVKRDKLRCRTALRSWMPRRGATIIGCGCLQNPVMLHDDMMSQFLGHCQVLGNLRSFSVANRFQKAALIAVAYQLTTEDPWCRTCRSEACNLIRHSPASALQLPHRSNRSCGKSLRIGCKWPLGTLKDLLSRDALTNSSILSVLLGKATPIPVSSAVCTHVIMMLSIRAGTGRLAREIWQVYVNDQSR